MSYRIISQNFLILADRQDFSRESMATKQMKKTTQILFKEVDNMLNLLKTTQKITDQYMSLDMKVKNIKKQNPAPH